MARIWWRVAAAAVLAACVPAGLLAVDLVSSPPTSTYVIAPIERGDIRVSVAAAGQVEPVLTVEVGSQISGRIADLLVDFNDEVRAGQPIARLDTAIYAARLRSTEAALDAARARARASLAARDKAAADLANSRASQRAAVARVAGAAARRDDAKREVTRRRALVERGNLATSEAEEAEANYAANQAQLDAAEAEVAMAAAAAASATADLAIRAAAIAEADAAVRQQEAEVEQARVDLDRAEIKAPIDGIVIARKVDRGQTVAASLEAPTLFTIAHGLDRVRVHTRVDEADIGVIRQGQRTSFTVDAFPDRRFLGTVSQIRKAPELVSNVVTYSVLIDAENPDLVLLPGMTATVEIIVEAAEQVLKAPSAALRFQASEAEALPPRQVAAATASIYDGTGRVWILESDQGLRPVQVAVGLSDLAFTEIRADSLAPGMPVAVAVAPTPPSWLERLGIGDRAWPR